MGPFAHMVLARQHGVPYLESLDIRVKQDRLAALLLGSIAPDAGFHPGADKQIARSAHYERPWAQARAMWRLAASPEEQFFALGWISHLAADKRGHRDLVYPQTDNSLDHESLEWGLDCHLLEQDRYAWLWRIEFPTRLPLVLWSRSSEEILGLKIQQSLMLRALNAETKNMRLIPWLEMLTGHTRPPGHPTWSRLGGIIGGPLGAGLRGICRAFRLGTSVEAVLRPSPPTRFSLQRWRELSEVHGRDIAAALSPTGSELAPLD